MKKNIVKSTFLVLALFVLAACKPADKLQVTRIDEQPEEEVVQRIIYTIPRTVIKVRVDYQRELSVPGPYRAYSAKFLGIEGGIAEKKEDWKITGVRVSSSSELDPSNIFAINILSGAFNPGVFMKLTDQGLIMDANYATAEYFSQPLENKYHAEETVFTDLSIHPNFEVKEETMYKTIVTDTGYMRVPMVRNQIEQKTMEKKAEEAAAFITKLRKRRFKLISGQYDVFPEGIALAEAVKRLDQTEAEYLSLFIGKKVTDNYSREFWYIPAGKAASEKNTLAAFSNNGGFSPVDGSLAEKLLIRVTAEKSEQAPLSVTTDEENFNRLFYRIPAMARVEVLLGDELLSDSRFQVAQSGFLVAIPVK